MQQPDKETSAPHIGTDEKCEECILAQQTVGGTGWNGHR